MKSTHRDFRGPSNSLLTRLYFPLCRATSIFRRRIDRCRRSDRSRCSKAIANLFDFALCLPSKVDASRFSGTEKFFADSPLLSPLPSNINFSMPIRSISMPRSVEVLENDRKRYLDFALFLPSNIDASRFSGTEHCFADSRLLSPLPSTIDFSTPIRSMSMTRSIEVLKNGRKLLRLCPISAV